MTRSRHAAENVLSDSIFVSTDICLRQFCQIRFDRIAQNHRQKQLPFGRVTGYEFIFYWFLTKNNFVEFPLRHLKKYIYIHILFKN